MTPTQNTASIDRVEQMELEYWAAEIRGLACLGDEDLLLGPEIATRMVGASNVVVIAGAGPARAEGRRILVPREHPDFNFAFAHEMAEIVLEERARFVGTHEEKERAANFIGSAVLTPPNTVMRAYAHLGERTEPVAEVFGVSQTLMRLRLGEVMKLECGVMTSQNEHVLFRNPERIDWTDIENIRDFAMSRGAYARPGARYRGLAKTRFRTAGVDSGRVSLRVTLKR